MKFIFPELKTILDNYDSDKKAYNEKVLDKFYKYTGIKPGTKITEEDIDEYWLTAFGRIGLEEGLTSEGLIDILLNK